MITPVKNAMLMLALLISAGALAPAALARAAADTPEHCQKRCMGNDTPTERANCLKTCPQASAPARTESELPASNQPPKRTVDPVRIKPPGTVSGYPTGGTVLVARARHN